MAYDEDYDEEEKKMDELRKAMHELMQKHPGFYVSTYGMPGCCSGLVLSSFYASKEDVPEKDLNEFMGLVVKTAGTHYSWLIATVLMGSQRNFAAALTAAGFEESVQASKSNNYNGPQPLKVFVKALRPLTVAEVEKELEHYKKKSAKAKKGGYEW